MLQTVHSSRKIRPKKFSVPKDRPRSHERVFKAVEPVYGKQAASDTDPIGPLGDAGVPELGLLVETYSEMRDDLAYRKLKGEALSARERVLLLVLNQLARLVMRPRTPSSDEALDAAAEIRRLRSHRTG